MTLTFCYATRLRRRNRLIVAIWALLLAVPLFACSDGTSPEPAPPPVGAVALGASRTELQIGEVMQLIATVLDTSGVVLQGRSVTWSSSDPQVLSVTGGGLVSAVSPGLATVRATSGGISGTLSITVLSGACRADITRPITPGQTHDDSLAPYDCVLLEEPFADGWEFTLTEQTSIVFTMRSSQFDALLLVTDPAITVGFAFDDDGGGGTDARLFHTFDPGTYILWATSVRSGSTGTYRLTSQVVEVASCDTPVGSIGPNTSVTDSLSFTDCARNGTISDPWSLSLATNARLAIGLSSSDFDPLLEVTDGSGRRVAINDDGGEGFNSLITADFAAGEYTVWVTSFGGSLTGRYSLTVSEPLPRGLFRQAPENIGINYGAPHYADDFTLAESATIREFRWWGSDGSNTTSAVRLFADNGNGAPEVHPFFEVLNPAIESFATNVAPRGPGPVFQNRATLSDLPVLEAGTRYYISISGPHSWLSSTAPGSEWWSRSQETDAWRNASATNPNNLSFELIGTSEMVLHALSAPDELKSDTRSICQSATKLRLWPC
jgi:hypothetical protein